MIGPKKLGTIRQELRRALAAAGDDPLHWLEQRMRAPQHQGKYEILRSLQRFLNASKATKRRKQRAR